MTSTLKYNAKNFVGQCHILQVVVSYNFWIKSRATATGQKCDFATGQKCKHMSGMQSWYWLSPQNTDLVITFLWLQNLNLLTKKMAGGKSKPKKIAYQKLIL